jgi:PKD repeat protein
MSKNLHAIRLFVFLAFSVFQVQAQESKQLLSIDRYAADKTVPQIFLPTPNMQAIHAEDIEREKTGVLHRIGVHHFTHITPTSAGTWKTLPNGDRLWQLNIKSPGAEALSFLFDRFQLFDRSSFWVQDKSGNLLHQKFTVADVQDHGMQHIPLCFGDEMTLNLLEPVGSKPSEFLIDRITYGYRDTGNPNIQKINESDPCQVNVNCNPEGNNWQDEKRGVARILVVDGNIQGWCTGSLVNNTAQDCKPLFLTALHCGVTSTTANFNQWKFYFRYEAPTCTNPSTAGILDDNIITGCVKLSDSGDGGGDSGSDFLLVQLGSTTNQATIINTLKSANFNAYWNGWDANTAAATGGVSIHHPAGDIKKISTYTGTLLSTQWGTASGSHWRVTWVSSANGHGVTEGGSSGSPIFNTNGGSSRIVGTLTGGSSFCTATSSPDLYGKMSYHWLSNGTAANRQLKTHLDPGNTGLLVLNGSADPCSAVTPSAPVANFVGTPLTLNVGGTVSFTDQSSGSPTSWAWTISPGTIGNQWTYAGGTSAASQNPQVTFNAAGQYTITLVATNGQGNDSEVKTNYITVNAATPTGPCAATSSTCDEFIRNVTLNTINNTTGCTNYGNYTSISTSLTRGQAYTLTVLPQITGQANPGAYTGDEIAAWIDYNNNNVFDEPSERIAYVIVGTGWSNQFNFTVPVGTTTGAKRLRVRISYSEDGAITPCGTSPFGEVEDYTVNIVASTASIFENNPLNAISVYPNPTSDVLFVDLSEISDETVMELYDITGKLLQKSTVISGGMETLSLQSFSPGIYQLRLINKGAETIQRIVKE